MSGNQSIAEWEMPKQLSICIATYNRCQFIGETLESLLAQTNDNVEIVLVDGASTDETQLVVAPYLLRHSNIRYFREQANSGVDQDYDKSVGYATGEYCWLMPDDDLLAPGAIALVLEQIAKRHDLIVVNSECWNADFSRNLNTRMLNCPSNKVFGGGDAEKVFAELASCLSYIGSVVIKRSVWLERDRASYYGTLFVHVGVIFQHPPIEQVAFIADPQIIIRYGNGMWTPRSFEIWYFKWPQLIWSFADFSVNAKQAIVLREPWRRAISLFKSRAMGDYSNREFVKFLSGRVVDVDIVLAYICSVFPAKAANVMWVLYYALIKRSARYSQFDILRSRHSSTVSRWLASVLGIKVL
jgi:abequosyltransferase